MSNSQKRNLVLGMLLMIAFALVGCSSHAPSASRFMAVKPNSISIGLSGGGVLGDDNSHREEKGKGEAYKYSELLYLLDGDLFF